MHWLDIKIYANIFSIKSWLFFIPKGHIFRRHAITFFLLFLFFFSTAVLKILLSSNVPYAIFAVCQSNFVLILLGENDYSDVLTDMIRASMKIWNVWIKLQTLSQIHLHWIQTGRVEKTGRRIYKLNSHVYKKKTIKNKRKPLQFHPIIPT